MTATKQKEPAAESWVRAGELSRRLGIPARGVLRALAKAAAGTSNRLGDQVKVRQVRGPGGASGRAYEVLIDSLAVDLRTAWYRQQPGHDLQDQVAEYLEQEQLQGAGEKGKKIFNQPWAQEDREARHAAFSRRPTAIQHEAARRLPHVRAFHALGGTEASVATRYAIVAKQAGESCSTIRRWVRACRGLDPGDWLIALAPGYGLRTVEREDAHSPEALEFIKSEYFRLTKPALAPIWRRAQHMSTERGWTISSYATVKRLIDREPRWRHVLAREGAETFDRLYPTQQRDYADLRVHQIWCGDGRKADVFCIFRDGTIGRPIVVSFMDIRTRVILGYAIGNVESADLIRLAVKYAAEKSRALPEEVLIDNGRGFASKLLTGGAPNRFRFKVKQEDPLGIFPLLGIKIIWATPYAGRSKPLESFWRTIAEAEKRFSGAYCGNTPDARPEDFDPKKAVQIESYRRLIDETLALYHRKPHRGAAMRGLSPSAVYEELIQRTPVRSPTREQLRLCLLAAEQIKLDPRDHAIRLLGNRYWSAKLADLNPTSLYTARFNPENASDPISLYQEARFICEAPLLHRTGFRDAQAAKDHLRAKAQFKRALKDQDRAAIERRKAATWITAPGSAEDPDPIADQVANAMLPPPSLPRLVIPQQNVRPVDHPSSSISLEDAQAAVAKYYNSRR